MNIFIKVACFKPWSILSARDKPSKFPRCTTVACEATQLERMKIAYWLTCLFLSMATVYCMFHYAVDVIAGLLLGFLAMLTFNRIGRKGVRKPYRGTCKE